MIMLDYKRILVPYDGSEYAKRALDRAVSMARCCDGAKLFIATVSRPMPPMEKIAREKAYVFDADKKEPEKKDPGQVILDDSEKLIPEDIPHELIFRVGNPGSVLLDLSFEKNCDLVIMGNRGRGALKSLFMGSVSSGILKNAKCPVFIIK